MRFGHRLKFEAQLIQAHPVPRQIPNGAVGFGVMIQRKYIKLTPEPGVFFSVYVIALECIISATLTQGRLEGG